MKTTVDSAQENRAQHGTRRHRKLINLLLNLIKKSLGIEMVRLCTLAMFEDKAIKLDELNNRMPTKI